MQTLIDRFVGGVCKRWTLLTAAALLLGSCCAYASSASEILIQRDAANAAYNTGDWNTSASLYATLAMQDPADGALWWRLGRAQSHLGDHHNAIVNYTKAMALGEVDRPNAIYRIAQEYAALGDKEVALTKLNEALSAGYRNKLDVASDDAFTGLRGDPRFAAMTGKPFVTSDRVKGWSHDLDYLLFEIRRVHYVYRDHPLPAAVLAGAAAFRTRVKKMSDAEALLSLQRIVAGLGDGHSLVYPAGMRRGQFHVLPLHLYWFSDGLFVVGASQNPDLIGARILRIGGLDPDVVAGRMKPFMSHDNDSEVRWVSPGYMIIAELLQMVGVPAGGGVHLTVRSGDGVVREVVMSPLSRAAEEGDYDVKLPAPNGVHAPLYLSQTDKNYWFADLPGGLLYLQFNSVHDDEKESLKAFSNRLRLALARPEVKGLVLDMRRNNGGEATLGADLLQTLIWFQAEKGQHAIADLVGRDTFSAAQNFTDWLDVIASPIYVGEPTASKPHHFGDEASFVLPYSGALGQLAPGEHRDSLYRDDRVWIAPTIPVEENSAAYFAGKDTALDAAIEVLTPRLGSAR